MVPVGLSSSIISIPKLLDDWEESDDWLCSGGLDPGLAVPSCGVSSQSSEARFVRDAALLIIVRSMDGGLIDRSFAGVVIRSSGINKPGGVSGSGLESCENISSGGSASTSPSPSACGLCLRRSVNSASAFAWLSPKPFDDFRTVLPSVASLSVNRTVAVPTTSVVAFDAVVDAF